MKQYYFGLKIFFINTKHAHDVDLLPYAITVETTYQRVPNSILKRCRKRQRKLQHFAERFPHISVQRTKCLHVRQTIRFISRLELYISPSAVGALRILFCRYYSPTYCAQSIYSLSLPHSMCPLCVAICLGHVCHRIIAL